MDYNARTAYRGAECAGRYTPVGFPDSDPPNPRHNKTLFGLWSQFTGNAGHLAVTPDLWDTIDLVTQNTGCLSRPTHWVANVYGVEVTRFNSTNPLQALTKGQILAESRRTAGRYVSRLKARIEWETLDTPRVVDFDVGTGIRLTVMGSAPKVSILVPRLLNASGDRVSNFVTHGTSINVAAENALERGPGIILDAVINCSVHPAFNGESCCKATYTVRILREANAGVIGGQELVIPMPSGAKWLNIDTNDNAAVGLMTPWHWAYRLNPDNTLPPVGDAVDAGAILYTAGDRVEHVQIPQIMQGIFLPIDAGVNFDRFWNVTFELEF